MKLYEVPRNTFIRYNDLVLEFKRIDGMYSVCTDIAGNTVHLAAYADVEILEKEELK